MNRSLNPLGQASTYQFQFGADTTYTFHQPMQDAGSGTSALPVSFPLAGLQPATTYHFRLAATNATGTTNGGDMTFATAAMTDSDGDGMPDDYETANGLNPNDATDAATDADGDRLTNLQEYLAGTDPR